MKKNSLVKLVPVFLAIIMIMPTQVFAQRKKDKEEKKETYEFTVIKEVPTTPVKSQDRVGSCWDYATTSFVETEILRMGKPELDLSEMFTIRYDYVNKANWYVRMQGKNNFNQGGQAHDVINVIREYGFVPDTIYHGIEYGEEVHNHSELTPMLTAILDVARQKKLGKLSPVWMDVFVSALETYLGESPDEFEWDGKTYTPIQFRDEMGFKAEDYVELTSFNHHPFYTTFPLEVPDNWSHDLYYNLPIDELVAVACNAFDKGYSVCWDGDVSERGNFMHADGYAVIPKELTDEEKEDLKLQDRPEAEICQCKRQEAFDVQTTTDDHLMHLTGVFKDQKGTKYFKTKNSWGPKGNDYGGFLFMSETYFRYKTIAIMVHKDAIPAEIKAKLGL